MHTAQVPATSTHHCSVQLTCDLSAPRAARHLIGLLLPQWGMDDQDLVDAAVLVASELVTNVLVHGEDGEPVTLVLEAAGDVLRLEVEDRAPAVPAQREAAADDESGRGLAIVAQLAAQWEVQPLPAGKRIVVELPLRRAHCA